MCSASSLLTLTSAGSGVLAECLRSPPGTLGSRLGAAWAFAAGTPPSVPPLPSVQLWVPSSPSARTLGSRPPPPPRHQVQVSVQAPQVQGGAEMMCPRSHPPGIGGRVSGLPPAGVCRCVRLQCVRSLAHAWAGVSRSAHQDPSRPASCCSSDPRLSEITTPLAPSPPLPGSLRAPALGDNHLTLSCHTLSPPFAKATLRVSCPRGRGRGRGGRGPGGPGWTPG